MPIVDGRWIPIHEADPVNVNEALVCGAVSTIFFTVLGIILTRRLNVIKNNDEYGARVCSLIHAIFSTAGCGYALYQHATDGGTFTSPTTRLQGDWHMFSFGYFFADTILMFIYKIDYLYILHHAVTLSCCGSVLMPGATWAMGASVAVAGGEITNPIMHTRWILAAEGKRDSAAVKWLTRLWFPIFFAMRYIVAPPLAYQMLQHMPPIFIPLIVGMTLESMRYFIKAALQYWRGEWWPG